MRTFLNKLRTRLRRLRNLADVSENPISFTKYYSGRPPGTELNLRYQPTPSTEALPVPPRDLWLGYGQDDASYLESGKTDVDAMLAILQSVGWAHQPDQPILDLGCGGGRMIRHLRSIAEKTPVWGMDISAPHISWLKTRLVPPFHFATNTTLPHLPFPDNHIGLVYCGSVFTHIDELAESWFMEVQRTLAPGGYLFCTLHDEHTREKLMSDPSQPLARSLRGHDLINSGVTVPDILVLGQDANSNVFYHSRYLHAMLAPLFEVVKIVPGAYGYQTAWVLRKRA
ncbi:class I SAM-dependent methyltransferase [Rariglobus hedericola]|uniref:Class I SAM-dependent methyltransferase n=1 Tax=Rariglobus hedericola TaxID=2597822 RepID=A0A556QPV8_9BACT|nr:class I SAM-dependent methyltransferase [Rariglobus hedericola]TSJ78683.1 class I SAM-dependent methyltransferase [Rariglobus hedericola]